MTNNNTLPATQICVDCKMGNHHLCDGELWVAAVPCTCPHEVV